MAAGGWHSAVISQYDDLYMFGWNESGQLAQPTNLAKPAECFSAVEKMLMACCTMQPEDAALPRGDAEDCEVYHKNDESESSVVNEPSDIEKDALTCYTTAACNNDTDLVVVQALPMLVTIPSGKSQDDASQAVDASCGSRHTVILTKANVLWAFGWNKYGQVGLFKLHWRLGSMITALVCFLVGSWSQLIKRRFGEGRSSKVHWKELQGENGTLW
jgi:hypothetical protein